jgi:Ca-activated chloride channel family protein
MLWRNPLFLWLLIVVAGTAGLMVVSVRRRMVLLSAFCDQPLVGRLVPHVDTRRRAWRSFLRTVLLAALVAALAGPKWGFHWQEVRREGIDLIIAIDTSRSMLATDVKPNRLERAKLAVLDLVRLLDGDRIGLVAFAGTAFLECPLTLDYAAFERSLQAVQVGLIPRGGTALARAIDTSLEGFEARQGKHEALILITDGEDNEGGVEEAAKRAADRGVKIYSVGIGTSEGELVPAGPGEEGYVKDRQGQVVKSRLDEKTLEQIALTTGGAYVRGLGAALGLDEVFRDHIAKMERREVASTLERRYEDRFQIPLAAALILLVLETLVTDRKQPPKRARLLGRLTAYGRRMRPAPSLVVLIITMPMLVGWLDPPGDRAAEGNRLYESGKYEEAAARYGEGLVDDPESMLLQFNLGTALYKQGKYAEALNSFTKVAAAGNEEWIARAAHNLGNTHYQLGSAAEEKDPQAAIASYEQALASYRRAMGADPQDRDAKLAHEIVARKLAELRKKLEEQQQEQPPQEEPPEGEQGEQPPDQEEEEQQPSGGEQEQAQEEQQEQEQQATAEAGKREQEQQAASSGAGEEGAEEPAAEEQAAQAVLDAARSEELGPEDVERQVGVAGLGEPLRDW